MGFTWLVGMTSFAYSPLGQALSSDDGQTRGVTALTALLGMAVVFALAAMVWSRRRWPFGYTVAAAIAGMLLPVGPMFALVGLAELIAWGRGKKLVVGSVAAAMVVVWSAVRDALAPAPDASLLQTMLMSGGGTGERIEVPVALIVGLIVFSLAIPVAVGLVMRLRYRERAVARQRDQLDGELGRSHERERIAHEIHDVLGHRLSQLSLRASALEARASSYPEVKEEATQMRLSAGRAMEDLRSLLRVIHGETNEVSLIELDEIIRGSIVDDQRLALTVYLRDAEQAPGEVARAVVRIVQEIITNARKHAPGRHLRLSVTGGPGEGVTIAAGNEMAVGNIASLGTGRGLSGMHERLRLLGGRFSAGQVGQEFRVDAHIPWPPPR